MIEHYKMDLYEYVEFVCNTNQQQCTSSACSVFVFELSFLRPSRIICKLFAKVIVDIFCLYSLAYSIIMVECANTESSYCLLENK